MEFENKKLKTRFTVPDTITVRQQLAYLSEAANITQSKMMEQTWKAATLLIETWESPHLPDYKLSLDEATDPKATDVIIWAALEVKKYINDLDKLPKN